MVKMVQVGLLNKLKNYATALFIILTVLFVFSCKSDNTSSSVGKPTTPLTVPKFEVDSAYSFLEAQLEFGYRIPGTEEHAACRDWIVSKRSIPILYLEKCFKKKRFCLS